MLLLWAGKTRQLRSTVERLLMAHFCRFGMVCYTDLAGRFLLKADTHENA
jgi:hypothetical protein